MPKITVPPPRVIVALLMTAGARTRPVCRTPGYRWRGTAHPVKRAAERERAVHLADHALQAALATSTPDLQGDPHESA